MSLYNIPFESSSFLRLFPPPLCSNVESALASIRAQVSCMGNQFYFQGISVAGDFSTFMQGNVRQDASNLSSTTTACLTHRVTWLLPHPTNSAGGHGGSTRNLMPMCQTHSSSLLDRPDRIGLDTYVQSLHIVNQFALTSHVVTSFIGCAL